MVSQLSFPLSYNYKSSNGCGTPSTEVDLIKVVWYVQFVAIKIGHQKFGYPVFTKEIEAAAWSILGEYLVT